MKHVPTNKFMTRATDTKSILFYWNAGFMNFLSLKPSHLYKLWMSYFNYSSLASAQASHHPSSHNHVSSTVFENGHFWGTPWLPSG